MTKSQKRNGKKQLIGSAVDNEELQEEAQHMNVDSISLDSFVSETETEDDMEQELEEECPIHLTPGRDPATMPDRAPRRKKYSGGLSEEEQCKREETKCKEMKKWKEGFRANIKWVKGVPLGKFHEYFTSYIGVLVRHPRNCPVLNIRSFSDIKDKYKDKMIEKLRRYFTWRGEHREDILKMMRSRYRDSMYNLRADHYWPNRFTHRMLRDAKPKKYTPQEWDWLLRYWGSKEFQDLSIQNQKNRNSEKALPHYGGRKKNIAVAQELKQKNRGNSPTRLEIYEAQHQKKGGGFSHPQVEYNIERLKTLVGESHARALQGLPHKNMDECFCEVLGDDWKGRVRGWGNCNITPTSLSITKRDRKRKKMDDMQHQLVLQEELIAEQAEELAYMRAVIQQLQSQQSPTYSPASTSTSASASASRSRCTSD